MCVCVFPHRLVCLFFLSRALSRALFRRPVSVRARTGVFFFFLFFFFVRIFFRSARMKTNEEKMHFVKSSKVVVIVIEKVVSRARSERAYYYIEYILTNKMDACISLSNYSCSAGYFLPEEESNKGCSSFSNFPLSNSFFSGANIGPLMSEGFFQNHPSHLCGSIVRSRPLKPSPT